VSDLKVEINQQTSTKQQLEARQLSTFPMSEQSLQQPETPSLDAVVPMKKPRNFTGCDYFSCQLQAEALSPDGKPVLQAPCHANLVVSVQDFTITTLKEVAAHRAHKTFPQSRLPGAVARALQDVNRVCQCR
jgi:hypothetical protein